MERARISQDVDLAVRDVFGTLASQTSVWWGDSDLSASWDYRVGPLDLVVWRDRGLYSILLCRSGAKYILSFDALANSLSQSTIVATGETPDELKAALEFIRDQTSEVLESLARVNIDSSGKTDLTFRGIPICALPNSNYDLTKGKAQQQNRG